MLETLKKLKVDNSFDDPLLECFKCKLLPIYKGSCVNRYVNKNRRACLMKNIEGSHFSKFLKKIISQAIKIMATTKINKIF